MKRQARSRWTTDLIQEFIGMWLRGDDTVEIGRTFGITVNGVTKLVVRLRNNGIPLPLRTRGHKAGRACLPWTQEEVETVVRMRSDGASSATIAAALDRSFYGVQGILLRLRDEGVPIRMLGSGTRKQWDPQRLVEAIAGRGLRVVGNELPAEAERKGEGK